jgi:hypothetical protein
MLLTTRVKHKHECFHSHHNEDSCWNLIHLIYSIQAMVVQWLSLAAMEFWALIRYLWMYVYLSVAMVWWSFAIKGFWSYGIFMNVRVVTNIVMVWWSFAVKGFWALWDTIIIVGMVTLLKDTIIIVGMVMLLKEAFFICCSVETLHKII